MSEQTTRGLGLDFGAGQCRVAALEGEEFRHLDLLLEMPTLFIPGWHQSSLLGGDQPAGILPFQKVSLKRLLGTDEPIAMGTERLTVQEMVRRILVQSKDRSEQKLQARVTGVGIAIPPCAGDRQRAAVRAAAQAAGFPEVRLVEDSRAAALAYLHTHPHRGKWLVYGLGRSAFFVSVLDTTQGFATLAHHGDFSLGGEDFDTRIVTWLVQQSGRPLSSLPLRNHLALAELYRLAEEAKVRLSESGKTAITLSDRLHGYPGPVSFTLTRENFETLITQDIERTLDLTHQAITEAGLTLPQIDGLFLLGRSTRIPLVRERLLQVLGLEPVDLPVSLVAKGAALYATQMGQCFTMTPALNAVSPAMSSPPPPAPGPPDSLARLAEIWDKLRRGLVADDPEAAIAAYHHFLETAATPLAGLYRKKAAQLMGVGQVEAATELLEKGIRHFPDRLVMTEKLADLYYQQAQGYYLRASQHPTFSKKYLNLCWEFLTKSLDYHRHHPQALELRKLLMSHKKTGKRRR